MILGIDHGYYAIKTRNCSFPAGITPFGDREPYTRQNVLTFRSSATKPPTTTTTC